MEAHHYCGQWSGEARLEVDGHGIHPIRRRLGLWASQYRLHRHSTGSRWIGVLILLALIPLALLVGLFFRLREQREWRSLAKKYGVRDRNV
jgi:hypothetical protein